MGSLEKELWDFVDEREAIRLRRRRGNSWPWTADPVLRDHHFTNVRRADDPGTKRIVDMLRSIGPDRVDLLLTAYLYRGLNRASTFDRYGLPGPDRRDLDAWFDELDDAKARGEKMGSPWHQTFYERYKRNAYYLLQDAELAASVFLARDGQGAVETLVRSGYGLGPFFGIQIVGDLAEAQVGTRFSRDTMVPVSAGSRIGLQLVEGTLDATLLDDVTYERSAAGRRLRDLRIDGPEQRRIERLILARPDLALTPVDVEHVLCEFSKYWLIRTGAPSGVRRAARLRRAPG